MNNHPKPPRWALRLLRWYCSDLFVDELEGDLFELFYRNAQLRGQKQAASLFVLGVLGSFRFYRSKKLKIHQLNIMLTNHFKVAFRHSLKHKAFSTVNLLSLFFGIAASFYIGVYVKNELSYDSFHENKADIYRILTGNPSQGWATANLSSQFGKVLRNEFSEVKVCSMGEDPVKIGTTNPILVEDFYWTDSTFFDLFSFNLLHGDPPTALADPAGLVITESLSRKLFDQANPVGEIIKVKIYDGDQEMNMKVTGVVADPPANSHIQFSGLGSMAVAESLYSKLVQQWGFRWVKTYAFAPGLSNSGIVESIPSVVEKYLGKETAPEVSIEFQPLNKVYLYSQDLGGNKLEGNIDNVITFSAIGFFILLIAVFNYINLSTARAITRAKEVGLRKTIGAGKTQLVSQFLAESIYYILVASSFAIGLIVLLIPVLNSWLHTQLSLSILTISDWLMIGTLILFVGVLAGLYPSFVMTRYSLINALAGSGTGKGTNIPRKVLITIQYCITIFLITGSVVIYLQFQFLKNYSLGFDQEQLINIPVNDRGLQAKIEVIKEAFMEIAGVEKATVSGEPLPARMQNMWGLNWPDSPYEDGIGINIVGVDRDYFEVVGLEMKEGTTFTLDFQADSSRSVVLNETALAKMELTSAINKTVNIGDEQRRVIGIVKDHHYTSLHTPIAPVAYLVTRPGYRISPDNILLRVSTNDLPVLISRLEASWQQFSPDDFELSFVDDAFARTYASEQKFARIVSAFTSVAIVIALCGVFGLITFLAESRQKEISIRKVLGASPVQLALLLSSDLAKLFALALIITGPAIYFFTDRWLANYPFHIALDFKVVLLVASCCLAISAIVVLWQANRILSVNPVDTLKSE